MKSVSKRHDETINPNSFGTKTMRPIFGIRRTTGFLAAFVLAFLALGGCSKSPSSGKLRIAMLPKLKTIAYFEACHQGAKKAAEELGVELIYDGPSSNSGSEQHKIMETWTRQRVDAICVAPNEPEAVPRFIEKAQKAGIPVLTWDSDAKTGGESSESQRKLFVNQIDDNVLGKALMDDIAKQMGEEGEWLVVIASLTAANLNNWRKIAEAHQKENYPNMKLVKPYIITNENENEAIEEVRSALNSNPNIKGIIAFDSNSLPGAAEAIKQSKKIGQIALTGCSSPDKMRPFIKEGVLESFYLWDPRELGELTVRLAVAVANGEEIKLGMKLKGYDKELRFSESDPTMIIMADPIRFTKDNIDEYQWGF
jgi:rhamnose transport system substrate-binding protein